MRSHAWSRKPRSGRSRSVRASTRVTCSFEKQLASTRIRRGSGAPETCRCIHGGKVVISAADERTTSVRVRTASSAGIEASSLSPIPASHAIDSTRAGSSSGASTRCSTASATMALPHASRRAREMAVVVSSQCDTASATSAAPPTPANTSSRSIG